MQLQMVQAIRQFLLSDRVKIGGHEVPLFMQMLAALQAEEMTQSEKKVVPLPSRPVGDVNG